MTLVDCIASRARRTARPLEIALRHRRLPARRGALCGFINGCRRRLWPHPADHRDAGDRRHLYRPRPVPRPDARRQGRRGSVLGDDQRRRRFADDLRLATTARAAGSTRSPDAGAARPACPDRAARLGAVPPLGHRPHRLRHRLGRRRGLHVGPAIDRAKLAAFTLGGLLRRPAAACFSPADLLGQRRHPAGRRLHAEFDRRGRHRRHVAPRRHRRRGRLDLRRLRPARRSRSTSASSTSHPLLQPLFEGIVLLAAVSLGAAPRAAAQEQAGGVPMSADRRRRLDARLAATTGRS